jgi:hypothetical protein
MVDHENGEVYDPCDGVELVLRHEDTLEINTNTNEL